MNALIKKLLKWLPVNLAGILGLIQAVIKVIKEILTIIVNILFPIIPGDGKFEETVLKVRELVNKIDKWVESIKGFFLKISA